MLSIICWNIQNGKGCDGVIDLGRIAKVIRALGEADVVCLQEVARHEPVYGGTDQVLELKRLFPGYEALYGETLKRAGERQYGNLILSRLPVLQGFNHLLPRPAEGGIKHMQRAAVEAVLETASGPLRVMTTHLEFWSTRHRQAQIARLREIQDEVAANAAAPAKDSPAPYDGVPRPASCVLCGDFNLLPDDPEYRALFEEGFPFVDAWRRLKGAAPHPHTAGIYDQEQWKEGPHCRDFFAVTADIANRVTMLAVDQETEASDHQPLRLTIEASSRSRR